MSARDAEMSVMVFFMKAV